MKSRYCFEIADDISAYYCFSYIDSEDNLADFLFKQMKVNVEPQMEFHNDDDPFKIVMCRIPRQQREAFLEAVDMLPGLMAYVGRAGYDEYCLDLMKSASQFLAEGKMANRITRLQ